jgi:hypothetical protein
MREETCNHRRYHTTATVDLFAGEITPPPPTCERRGGFPQKEGEVLGRR